MKHLFLSLIAICIYISTNAQQGFVEATHYLFPEFTKGVVLMKDGKKNHALLNYNSLTEEMIFDNHGQKLAIAKTQLPKIDTVLIQDRKFVVLNNKFVELIYHSSWQLLIEHKCKVEEEGPSTGYGGTSQTSAVTSVSETTVDGRYVYNLTLPEGYKTKPYIYYWIKKDTHIYYCRSMKELKKLFVDKKDLVKKYSKSHRVRYNEPETITGLIAYLESS